MAAQLTQAELKAMLTYNPRTGSFRWLRGRPGRRLDGLAGCINTHGYRVIRINGVDHYGHRLAFLYMTGQWPLRTVDHRNGNPSDNRWSNLRDVSHKTNVRNCTKATKNAICRGVTWDEERGQYKAQLYANGFVRLNKRFDDLGDAIAAYAHARSIWHSRL